MVCYFYFYTSFFLAFLRVFKIDSRRKKRHSSSAAFCLCAIQKQVAEVRTSSIVYLPKARALPRSPSCCTLQMLRPRFAKFPTILGSESKIQGSWVVCVDEVGSPIMSIQKLLLRIEIKNCTPSNHLKSVKC